uniref:ParA family protein n=1 Tax=Picosynechococcus sp. PCC 7117 TaxID=195498 RepID=UPI000810E958|nr:ParA family protein [Picosynechococcus sp. PCC 7117]ANV88867.1 chromosome partitioning protein ParA [Picosynechococcus sp. PCC 7117]
MFITVAGFKGGVGKTTTAIHLACFFSTLGDTLLVDGDPNHSATGWAKRGSLPFKVVDLMAAGRYSRDFDHVIIDTAARPDKEELEALSDGCDLLVLPTSPDALAIDALLQTVDLLEEVGGDYRVLLTLVHPPPVKSAEMAREALLDAGLKLFDGEIRRYIAHEKASLLGVPVYESGDRRGKIAWRDYENIGKEIVG